MAEAAPAAERDQEPPDGPWKRRGLCVWIAGLSAPIALLLVLAALPPGTYYTLVVAAVVFASILAVPWIYALGSALARGRRGLAGRVCLLAPLPAVWLFALVLLPSERFDRVVFAGSRGALERAVAQAQALPEREVLLQRRWVGPYLVREVRRYQDAVVIEVAGTRGFRYVHGLLKADAAGLARLASRIEGLELRPLGNDWYAYRAPPSWYD
jgi:hypothetical protein